ncbi:MAG: tetratricopeptide repeat protein [Gammaproteobacteria bacterium]|nr:tetratricopeptide repeat protein [Gammaproteobacteria bacterium]
MDGARTCRHSHHPRPARGWRVAAALLALAVHGLCGASPRVPSSDAEVLATLPRGVAYSGVAIRQQAAARLDVALPLAQFYISQARASGDLRFLGYAEALLVRWRSQTPPVPAALVLEGTILQSRHAFSAALAELDRALAAQPDDAQAWVTRATVLRVLGRYDDAADSCRHIAAADATFARLCTESVRSLAGHLAESYAALMALPEASLAAAARAWRCSELAEMAVRLGDAAAAARWFASALALAPDDVYTRAAYADLLLDTGRPRAALDLLAGYESMEPILLRVAIAERQLEDPRAERTRAQLAEAFALEERRGEQVHRREQARFLLEVARDVPAALGAAEENWRVQREPADALILLRAAQAAGRTGAAAPALEFLHREHTEDARLDPYLAARR